MPGIRHKPSREVCPPSQSITEIIMLLEFCLDATYLTFCGSVYRQIQGRVMGYPVSVTVANLVREDVEQSPSYLFQLPTEVLETLCR